MRNPVIKEMKSVSDENENAKQTAEVNDRFRLRFSVPFLEKALVVLGDIVATRSVIALPSQGSGFHLGEGPPFR